jgi:hypothetical protein
VTLSAILHWFRVVNNHADTYGCVGSYVGNTEGWIVLRVEGREIAYHPSELVYWYAS